VDDGTVLDHLDKVRFLAGELARRGIEVERPVGGHGVAIDPPQGVEHAAHALAAEIYLEGGVRAAVFGGSVRFAVPRRVLTRDHLARVAEVVGRACSRRPMALECVHAPEEFFSFFARFEPSRKTRR
jgi:tryptophanase